MDMEGMGRRLGEWADLMARSQAVLTQSQAGAAAKASGEEFSVLDGNTILGAYARAWSGLMSDPIALTQYAQTAWTDWARAWRDAWLGESEGTRDKRFRDKRWDADPVARGLRDSHIALERATENFLMGLPEGSKDTLRVKFYTRQFLSALAPANFLALNPAARERFLETEGDSLLEGFRNLVEDLERGKGRLDIATHDPSAFEVGRDLATTPGKVVWQNALM